MPYRRVLQPAVGIIPGTPGYPNSARCSIRENRLLRAILYRRGRIIGSGLAIPRAFPSPRLKSARGTLVDVSVRVLSSVCMRRRTEPRNAGLWFRADCAGLTARCGMPPTVPEVPRLRPPFGALVGLAPHSQDFFVPALLRERGTASRDEQAALRQRGSSRLVQPGRSRRDWAAQRELRSSGVGDDVFTALS